jgi:hypothetical protein
MAVPRSGRKLPNFLLEWWSRGGSNFAILMLAFDRSRRLVYQPYSAFLSKDYLFC